ncbi:ORF6N domain-containing protein [Xenorhabdus sp. XENO-10]|uniref:ORF6N domain-containing protein n=1 Tax=Xenorhabdus yunnanensis TaxID=3025878 RepID=A0ABT5LJR4_9GAMM|nr:ORF6N domain-containing protein [Xenorhabdus yunnanensis]MDC9591353.1 ORF6N domain-containing protein [Xenorhabdus yunnanensis]
MTEHEQAKGFLNKFPVIEWEGKRVFTLAMIDELHKRYKGSTERNFRINKNKFKYGVDTFLLKSKKELNPLPPGIVDSKASHLRLITESGYLILIKIMRDPLAWETQKEIIANYFNGKG